MKAPAWLAALAFVTPAGAEPLAYITDQGSDSVSVVDVASGKTLERVKVGHKPAGVAVAPGGRRSITETLDPSGLLT